MTVKIFNTSAGFKEAKLMKCFGPFLNAHQHIESRK
jgi:hypothetical protein